MILRWAACKWGIDENLVRAQAWTESKWIQGGPNRSDGGGDKRVLKTQCVRGNFDALWDYGCDSCCYQSWGILQTKVYYATNTWPLIKDSTAFNADYRYGEERACIDGEFWPYFRSAAQQPNTYASDVASGDPSRLLWGCTGMHFSGGWYDRDALRYIGEVREALHVRPWTRLPRR
jgi:autotransporter family porin